VRDYFYVEDGAAAYMHLAEHLAKNPKLKGEAFNFSNEIQMTVSQVVKKILSIMGSSLQTDIRNEASNEILHQCLSAEKARTQLGWKPLFDLQLGLEKTVYWYKDFFGVK
jgi:CDP-glucose 4,6-dehydratase